MGAYARDINMVPAIPSFPADIASKRVAYKRLLSRFKSPATLRSKSSTCVTSAAADAEAYNSGASSADAEPSSSGTSPADAEAYNSGTSPADSEVYNSGTSPADAEAYNSGTLPAEAEFVEGIESVVSPTAEDFLMLCAFTSVMVPVTHRLIAEIKKIQFF